MCVVVMCFTCAGRDIVLCVCVDVISMLLSHVFSCSLCVLFVFFSCADDWDEFVGEDHPVDIVW